jgi:hypothetical protein
MQPPFAGAHARRWSADPAAAVMIGQMGIALGLGGGASGCSAGLQPDPGIA